EAHVGVREVVRTLRNGVGGVRAVRVDQDDAYREWRTLRRHRYVEPVDLANAERLRDEAALYAERVEVRGCGRGVQSRRTADGTDVLAHRASRCLHRLAAGPVVGDRDGRIDLGVRVADRGQLVLVDQEGVSDGRRRAVGVVVALRRLYRGERVQQSGALLVR